MLTEHFRIVAVDKDALWVETIQKSTCGACIAKKACGQTLLSQLGVKPVYLRVPLADRSPERYCIDQIIEIGIPENLVVRGSLLAYFLPIILALVFAGVIHIYWSIEWLSIAGFACGMAVGCVLIRWHASYSLNKGCYQATIIDKKSLTEPLDFSS